MQEKIDLKQLKSLNSQEPYTVQDAQKAIRVLFPGRNKNITRRINSYDLKHILERVAGAHFGRHKYCSNDVVKEAFKAEGFKHLPKGSHNECYNIALGDLTTIKKRLINNPYLDDNNIMA